MTMPIPPNPSFTMSHTMDVWQQTIQTALQTLVHLRKKEPEELREEGIDFRETLRIYERFARLSPHDEECRKEAFLLCLHCGITVSSTPLDLPEFFPLVIEKAFLHVLQTLHSRHASNYRTMQAICDLLKNCPSASEQDMQRLLNDILDLHPNHLEPVLLAATLASKECGETPCLSFWKTSLSARHAFLFYLQTLAKLHLQACQTYFTDSLIKQLVTQAKDLYALTLAIRIACRIAKKDPHLIGPKSLLRILAECNDIRNIAKEGVVEPIEDDVVPWGVTLDRTLVDLANVGALRGRVRVVGVGHYDDPLAVRKEDRVRPLSPRPPPAPKYKQHPPIHFLDLFIGSVFEVFCLHRCTLENFEWMGRLLREPHIKGHLNGYVPSEIAELFDLLYPWLKLEQTPTEKAMGLKIATHTQADIIRAFLKISREHRAEIVKLCKGLFDAISELERPKIVDILSTVTHERRSGILQKFLGVAPTETLDMRSAMRLTMLTIMTLLPDEQLTPQMMQEIFQLALCMEKGAYILIEKALRRLPLNDRANFICWCRHFLQTCGNTPVLRCAQAAWIIERFGLIPPELQQHVLDMLSQAFDKNPKLFHTSNLFQFLLTHDEANHERYFSYWTDLLEHSSDEVLIKTLCQEILRTKGDYRFDENHPLVKAALDAFDRLTTIEDSPDNPFDIFRALLSLRQAENGAIPPPILDRLFFNVEQMRRIGLERKKQLALSHQRPKGVGPNSLIELVGAMKQRIQELSPERQKAIFQAIEENYGASWEVLLEEGVVGSRHFHNLLSIEPRADFPLPVEAIQFWDIVKYVLNQSPLLVADKMFSPREEALLSMAASLRGCSTGKDQGIEVLHGVWRLYQPQIVGMENGAFRMHQMQVLIYQIIQRAIIDMISGDTPFMRNVTNSQGPVQQLSHQALFVMNQIGWIVGAGRDCTFDPYVAIISQTLLHQGMEVTLEEFYAHFTPQHIIHTLAEQITLEMKDLFSANDKKRTQAQQLYRELNACFFSEHDLSSVWEERPMLTEIVNGEEITQDIPHLTEEAARSILVASGFLVVAKPKPPSLPPLDLSDIL